MTTKAKSRKESPHVAADKGPAAPLSVSECGIPVPWPCEAAAASQFRRHGLQSWLTHRPLRVAMDVCGDSIACAPGVPAPMDELPPDLSADDIATAVRVLSRCGADDGALFRARPLRAVRKAVFPLLALASSLQFGGADPAAYAAAQERKKRAALERNAQKLEDRRFLDKTRLRAGRAAKLSALTAQADGAGAAVPFLLDGVAEDDAPMSAAGNAALDDADGGELAESDRADNFSGRDAAVKSEGGGEGDGGGGVAGEVPADAKGEGSGDAPRLLHGARACYVCKRRFRELHEFYDTLCPACASLNYRKRMQTADLAGRYALVTGARVKIGFHCTLKLLRAGAHVIATSRFPADAAARFAAVADADVWASRLEIVGLDFRDLTTLESFCTTLLRELPRLDIIINNACQTVRRPAAYYAPLMPAEVAPRSDPRTARFLLRDERFSAELSRAMSQRGAVRSLGDSTGAVGGAAIAETTRELIADAVPVGASVGAAVTLFGRSAPALSQMILTSDDAAGAAHMPEGIRDVNSQQVDLRRHNSWLARLDEVSTPELAEVMTINSMAPYLLVARLKPLLIRGYLRAGGGAFAGVSCDTQSGEPGAEGGGGSLAETLLRNESGAAKRPRREVGGPVDVEGARADSAGIPAARARFVVNVSSMEGKFYRAKLATHPHTNMAKAALNMMTRTSAAEFAEDFIYMTAVDTGCVTCACFLQRVRVRAFSRRLCVI